jgi:hypothetical protein
MLRMQYRLMKNWIIDHSHAPNMVNVTSASSIIKA